MLWSPFYRWEDWCGEMSVACPRSRGWWITEPKFRSRQPEPPVHCPRCTSPACGFVFGFVFCEFVYATGIMRWEKIVFCLHSAWSHFCLKGRMPRNRLSVNRLVFAATVDFPSTWTTPFTSTVLWHQPWGKLVLINVALGMKFLTKRAGWGRQNGKTGMREGECLVLVGFVAEMVLVPSTTAETEMVLEYLLVQLICGAYCLWQWWRS